MQNVIYSAAEDKEEVRPQATPAGPKCKLHRNFGNFHVLGMFVVQIMVSVVYLKNTNKETSLGCHVTLNILLRLPC